MRDMSSTNDAKNAPLSASVAAIFSVFQLRTVAISASVSRLPSNIDHQMPGQKYTFGADKAA
jgi:hypothetical protein